MKSLNNLTQMFAKLPGLGPRSARRLALYLVQDKQKMLFLAEQMQEVAQEVKTCSICANIDIMDPCSICSDPNREKSLLCIIESVADLWAMERANFFKGRYHVVGGNISALEGNTPDKLNLRSLSERVKLEHITEVVIAMNLSLEGQATAHYIVDLLEDLGVKITRLAHGIPMGAELDYMDEGTLALAMKLRQDV